MREKLQLTQDFLKEHDIEGWLLYDFQKLNPFALDFLEISPETMITRRFFYLIPKIGEPVKVVSKIEPEILNHLPGKTLTYQSYKSLKKQLDDLLSDLSSVAMEYSPMCDLPYLSKIDAGTYELIKSLGPDVISSANILQYFSSTLREDQIQSHRKAASFLVETVDKAFEYIKQALKEEKSLTEYDVQQFILGEFKQHGFYSEHDVICAFGKNTADPHYVPEKKTALLLEKEQLILLDIFAKSEAKESIYADTCFMGYTGSKLPEKIQETLALVQSAQKEALEFIQERVDEKRIIRGFEVDEICRNVIKSKGLAKHFIHRTGHNLHTSLHGPGAHLDGFETIDDRPLIKNTAFTIEPGIYFQNEFGIRLEIDVLMLKDKIEVTTPMKNIINYLI